MQSLPPRRVESTQPTNPHSVLEAIGATAGRQHQPSVQFKDRHSRSVPTGLDTPSGFRIVHPDDVTAIESPTAEADQVQMAPESLVGMSDQGILHSTVESAKQIQQLATRLEQIKNDLVAKESAVDHKIQKWETRVEEKEVDLEMRGSQLRQQASQIRQQQKCLMQLQEDIVKSNHAAKNAISAIVTEEAENRNRDNLVLQMEMLNHELGQRFDYIARRWNQLFEMLENQRVSIVAENSIDDRVWWG